jgi:hypothetical protein
MTLDELKNDVHMYLTVSGALPRILPDLEIERIIENEAKPWFWEQSNESVIKEYLYVPKTSFTVDPTTGYKYVKLPCNVQNIVWVYKTDERSLYQLGISAPDLSVNLGVSNQPYLSSVQTVIGDLGVYKVIIDSFSDMLDQLSKFTLKYDFNKASKDLHILTSMGHTQYMDQLSSIILEVYSHIPDEDLFELDHFKRYVRAKAGIQLGNLLLRYSYQLPGGVTINADAVLSHAEKEMETLMEEMNKQKGNSSFFFMVKK